MKNYIFVKKTLFFLTFLALLISCEDKMDEHYEVPSWLKGSAWEVLNNENSEDSYNIFLEGIELAGFKPIVDGKNIMTVMAPNDEAFKTYLKAKGYSSIKDMDPKELKKLIGFHLLYYSYNKEKLINFRPTDGETATEEDKAIDAGLYYKFRSRSSDGLSTIIDPSDEREKKIYHLDRFVPIFSYKFFNTKRIDAKSNYEFFYPNSTWSGNEGFNVSNATVNQYQILADNGYIYKVDRVLEPLETIYTELEKKEDYSIFNKLYNSYSYYQYDPTLSDNYGEDLGTGKDSLYLHYHSLANIALEWPTSKHTNLEELSRTAYSLFAPTNNALNRFFQEYWGKGGYKSIEEVETLSIEQFIKSFYIDNSPVFPEELTKKDQELFKNIVSFELSDVKDRAMCVNGTFYGIDNFSTPNNLASVAGPAFKYKDFATYLYILSGSSMLMPLMSQESSFITLIPSNKQLEAADILLNEYTSGKILQTYSEEGELVDLTEYSMKEILNMHVINTDGELKKTGTQILPTQTAFNYWYIKDGKITSSALFSENYTKFENIVDPFITFKEIVNDDKKPWSNGKAYSYDLNGIFTKEASDGLNYKLSVSNEVRDSYYLFSQLLKKAGLVASNKISRLIGFRFIAFVPTNDALQAALDADLIPGIVGGLNGTIDKSKLAQYMLSYFISSESNVITSYPYPGSEFKSGTFTTPAATNLIYTDNGTSLSIQLVGSSGNVSKVITDYSYFPFAFNDGAFHFIDSIL